MLAVLIFSLLFLNSVGVDAKFKNLVCTVDNDGFGEFLLCKINPINRYRNSMTIHYRQKTLVNKIYLRIEFFKRANGWRPFLYNFTFNLCEFLNHKDHYLFSLVYGYVMPYLGNNYTCPLKPNDEVQCNNYEMDWDNFRKRFPVETGEYALHISFITQNQVKVLLKATSEYKNYREH